MKKISTSYIWLGGALLLLCSIIALYVWAVTTVQQRSERASELESSYRQSMARFYGSSQEQRLLERTASSRQALDALFISEEEIARFFEMLERGAHDANVELEVISARTEEGNDITVQFRAQGQEDEVQSFLEIVESLPLVFDIRDVDIEHTSTDAISSSWSTRITLRLIII